MNKSKKSEQCSALSRNENRHQKADRTMINSKTTAYIAPHADQVEHMTKGNVTTLLSDNSIACLTHCGTRRFRFITHDGPQKLSLSNTQLLLEASMSSLSVPMLTEKYIRIFVIPQFA